MRWNVSALVMVAVLMSGAAVAADYYVAPNGKADAAGTLEAPWDILSALNGTQKAVQPGDTIWLRGGTYTCEAAYAKKTLGYDVNLVGAADKTIQVRPYQGERVIIDGGLCVTANCAYTWIWNLEIAPPPDKILPHISKETGSWPNDLPGPNGGLSIYGGKGSKFIDLCIHDNLASGVSFWVGSVDSEIYGCVIFGNGWKASDRNHGHCIYTQNNEGTKTISNCILTTPFGGGQFLVHAYGSAKAYVNNFAITQNISYAPGDFLIGGGRPSENIALQGNYFYGTPAQLGGYGAAHNDNGALQGNTLLNATLTVHDYTNLAVEGNMIVGGKLDLLNCTNVATVNNTIMGDNRPTEPKIALLPNKYDLNRANLVIFNWQKAEKVDVKVAPFLAPGDDYRIMKPEDLYGKPVLEGKCAGDTLSVPMANEIGAFVVANEFGAFVMFKGAMPATAIQQVIYTCPMHPQIEQTAPGKCPICGMTLVPKK